MTENLPYDDGIVQTSQEIGDMSWLDEFCKLYRDRAEWYINAAIKAEDIGDDQKADLFQRKAAHQIQFIYTIRHFMVDEWDFNMWWVGRKVARGQLK